ncbi:PREDICTED: fatty acyl-CoA reductase 1-like [Priapulus caudatus]|uniref:Fatty acyl-CoA reductase n=1 Tax=Priapulus caudatus TaxID=37621 RepID=A0ABM1FAS8_PRICU|nr:PREDICTED: fatty acyl-CoA reductase 1-like [Priapulus caudatus]
MNEFMLQVLFNAVKNENPDIVEKLHIIGGDVSEPRLGLSDSDYELLTDKINVILHVAASINFIEPLRYAGALPESAKHLQAIASHFYSICRPSLEVIVSRNSTNSRETIMTSSPLFWTCDDAAAETCTPELFCDAPNTYVYTKHMAECVLADEASDLPDSYRQANLVTSTWKDDL